MKKIILLVFFSLLGSFAGLQEFERISCESLSKVVDAKVYDEKNAFLAVTKEQLLEDFEAFAYYLRTSYIAYEKMVEGGLDFEEFRGDIKNKIALDEVETADDLITDIHSELKKYIIDSHFSIASNNCLYIFAPKNAYSENTFSKKLLIKEYSKSVYIRISDYLPDFFSSESEVSKYFKGIFSKYERIKNKRNIVIDLRDCPGGSTDYLLLFLYSLYEGKNTVIPSDIYNARLLQADLIQRSVKSIESPVTESVKYQCALKTGAEGVADEFLTSYIMQR